MIATWLAQHRLAFMLVLARMWRTPLAMLMMMGVIGITLCLPAVMYVAIDNLQRFAGDIQSTPQISLFLSMETSADDIQELEQRLQSHQNVKSHRFIGRDTAWQELQQSTGLGDIAGGLEKNPLPDTYIVHAKSADPAMLEQLQQEMQKWPGVELAQLDAAWIKRLHSLLELGRKIITFITGLLGFAVLTIMGNSIRLQIMTQREEIELSRLIGATDRFIRRPFLYSGVLYGLGGGLAALLMLSAIIWLFNLSVADLAQQYASDFRLIVPAASLGIVVVGGSAILGWIGSYWAVSRALTNLDNF
jgi:cell division transport system permease protein